MSLQDLQPGDLVRVNGNFDSGAHPQYIQFIGKLIHPIRDYNYILGPKIKINNYSSFWFQLEIEDPKLWPYLQGVNKTFSKLDLLQCSLYYCDRYEIIGKVEEW